MATMLFGSYRPDESFDEEKYELVPKGNPEVGGLVFVHSHQRKDCVGGPFKVVHVYDYEYTAYEVPGVGLASTFRERLFVVKEKTGGDS